MVDEIGPDTNEKMRALCKKISVAHDLDAEIQEELYSHIEDKLLAYLNGEETLTEEDAFILVREHFGDPSALKGLLQDVHPFEAQATLARRLAAAMIVTSGVTVASTYAAVAAYEIEIWQLHNLNYDLVPVLTAAGCAVFPWLLLLHWQRRLDTGHRPWFLTWHPAYLVCAIAVLSVVSPPVVSGMRLYSTVETFFPLNIWPLILAVMVASPVLNCMAWLWWCDRPPRKAGALASVASVWIVWAWFSPSVGNAIQTVFVPNTAQPGTTVTVSTLMYALMYAFVSYGLYRIARRKHGHTHLPMISK